MADEVSNEETTLERIQSLESALAMTIGILVEKGLTTEEDIYKRLKELENKEEIKEEVKEDGN